MTGWRDTLLKMFTPEVARLTLCADPDGVLAEEALFAEIRARGFEIFTYGEPVSFRFAYETWRREQWDNGMQTSLVVIVPGSLEDLQQLPYDLLQIGQVRSFALSDLFPGLHSTVLCELDRSDLDMIDRAIPQIGKASLSEDATRELVLQHVFGVVPALITQPAELLRILLSLHRRDRLFPPSLQGYLIRVLRQRPQFADWPLEQIVADRVALLAFLQERWPIHLDRLAREMGAPTLRETGVGYHVQFAGPDHVPFEDPDVRVYVESLFLDGLLHPIGHPASGRLAQRRGMVGLNSNPVIDRVRRLEHLIDTSERAIPGEKARHREWLAFAHRWAELAVRWHETTEDQHDHALDQRYQGLCEKVDQLFLAWMQRRYAGLANQPPVPPVMVHHIPRTLARLHEQDSQQRLALLLLDGLALDQWVIVREVLGQQLPNCRFDEDALFAWLPTITPVSRQAIFAGKPPLLFAASINTTNKEASLWAHYWSEWQLTPAAVGYQRGLGTQESLNSVREQLTNPRMRVLGLVVDTVDRIMHGMQLGSAGMHNQVRQWAQSGWLAALIGLLLDGGYRIFCTSDHGNVEATGCGNPNEGMAADLRGGRVRAYTERALRATVHSRFPSAIAWEPIGLPPDYFALFPSARTAFGPPGERIVAHGGPSLQEVIVPFVQITRTIV